MLAHENSQLSNDPIMKLGTAFFASKVLLSAIELKLFTILANNPLSETELQKKLKLNDRAAKDFFDALVMLGMLTRQENIYYNTAETEFFLDQNKDSYCGHWLEMANRRLYKHWDNLTAALQTGKPQNEFKHLEDPFDAIYADQSNLDNFLNEMGDVSRPLINEIASVFNWHDKKTFIDIGTCQGIFPTHLALLHPHLRGGGFDLPKLKNAFNAYTQAHNLTDRLNFYPGNFHCDPLPTADVLVMGHVLVDWDIQVRKQLIAKAFSALPKHGYLLIYDMMTDNMKSSNVAALLMSLNMLIETQGGSTYSESDCRLWLQEAGFDEIQIVKLNKTHSLAIACKP